MKTLFDWHNTSIFDQFPFSNVLIDSVKSTSNSSFSRDRVRRLVWREWRKPTHGGYWEELRSSSLVISLISKSHALGITLSWDLHSYGSPEQMLKMAFNLDWLFKHFSFELDANHSQIFIPSLLKFWRMNILILIEKRCKQKRLECQKLGSKMWSRSESQKSEGCFSMFSAAQDKTTEESHFKPGEFADKSERHWATLSLVVVRLCRTLRTSVR